MRKRKKLQAPPVITASDLLDEIQAAAYLVIKPRTLRLWRNSRGLPHLKITSKEIRYRRSDLDGWLNRHRVCIAA